MWAFMRANKFMMPKSISKHMHSYLFYLLKGIWQSLEKHMSASEKQPIISKGVFFKLYQASCNPHSLPYKMGTMKAWDYMAAIQRLFKTYIKKW
eukprot:c13600_g2_i1 orf=372-653(+)